MAFPFTTKMRLDVDDPALYPGQTVTAIRNPDGKRGGWGWLTAAGRAYGVVLAGGVQALAYDGPAAGGASANMLSEAAPAAAGQPYGAYVELPAPPSGGAAFNWQMQLKFYDATDTLLTTVNSGLVPGAGTNSVSTAAAPAGTVTARLQLNLRNGAGAVPSAALTGYARDVRMGPTTNFATLRAEPVWRNLMTSATSVDVERAPLEAGTLSAVIPDATYDPSVNTLLRAGRRLRLVAVDAANVDQVLFEGKVAPASVTYAPLRADNKRARITLTALDPDTDLAQIPRPDGVATVPELRTLLEGAGMPWRINGDTGQALAATPITRNESATLRDQIIVTRDSTNGYAWVDRTGVLVAYDGATMPTNLAATFTESTYGEDLEPAFDPAQVINLVTIKLLRRNAATGETVEVPFGPYREETSIRLWTPRSAEFTVQGLAETDAAMRAYAAAVFTANATPKVQVDEMTFRVATTADVVTSRALLDLYDRVRVTNSTTGLDQTARVSTIKHRITPKNWLVTLGFAGDTNVAAPKRTAPLKSVPTLTPAPTQQSGQASFGTFTVGTTQTVAVTFPQEFATVPRVLAIVRSTTPNAFTAPTVAGHSTTGCTLHLVRTSGTPGVNVDWFAFT